MDRERELDFPVEPDVTILAKGAEIVPFRNSVQREPALFFDTTNRPLDTFPLTFFLSLTEYTSIGLFPLFCFSSSLRFAAGTFASACATVGAPTIVLTLSQRKEIKIIVNSRNLGQSQVTTFRHVTRFAPLDVWSWHDQILQSSTLRV